MRTSEPQTKTVTKLKRIRWLSEQNSEKEYQHLMHLFNEEALTECYHELDGKKAVGEDGVDKQKYGEDLDTNLRELISKMKRMGYRPGPVRQVMIPQAGNSHKKRPLGICNFEDKIVQKMMQKVLESIYEPIFYECSYGFRIGIGCIDAIKALRHHLYINEVETVIDIDLANFFGSIDHQEVVTLLRKKIKDEKLIRYIVRMFKSGILSEGELTLSNEGVPQGSPVSPVIANIFAHYVIDEWFEKIVKMHCRGKVKLFRYCDDAVICCQNEEDGARIKRALSKRLGKYGLKLNEEKTTCVSFSRSKSHRGEKQGVFQFLGFVFYWGKTRNGIYIPKIKTSGKTMRSKLKNVNEWSRKVRNIYRLVDIWKLFCTKLTGHIRYFGTSFNRDRVSAFVNKAVQILFKWLNRRSQRKSFEWKKFVLFMEKHPLPTIKVYHKLF